MKPALLLDANLPRSSGRVLRQAGFDVREVREALPPGAPDESVAGLARQENRLLVTRDFDFFDIRNYPPAVYPGIVVIQLPDDARAEQVTRVVQAFLADEARLPLLAGRLAIVQHGRVRYRPPLPIPPP